MCPFCHSGVKVVLLSLDRNESFIYKRHYYILMSHEVSQKMRANKHEPEPLCPFADLLLEMKRDSEMMKQEKIKRGEFYDS